MLRPGVDTPHHRLLYAGDPRLGGVIHCLDNESEHIADGINRHRNWVPAILLANHGVFTFETTVRKAPKAAVMVEDAAQTLGLAAQLGDSRCLPTDEITKWWGSLSLHLRPGVQGTRRLGSGSILRFVQQYCVANREVFMALEAEFAAMERRRSDWLRGRRYQPVSGREPTPYPYLGARVATWAWATRRSPGWAATRDTRSSSGARRPVSQTPTPRSSKPWICEPDRGTGLRRTNEELTP